ncbi:unnamed protein product [Rhizopus microsporus]
MSDKENKNEPVEIPSTLETGRRARSPNLLEERNVVLLNKENIKSDESRTESKRNDATVKKDTYLKELEPLKLKHRPGKEKIKEKEQEEELTDELYKLQEELKSQKEYYQLLDTEYKKLKKELNERSKEEIEASIEKIRSEYEEYKEIVKELDQTLDSLNQEGLSIVDLLDKKDQEIARLEKELLKVESDYFKYKYETSSESTL